METAGIAMPDLVDAEVIGCAGLRDRKTYPPIAKLDTKTAGGPAHVKNGCDAAPGDDSAFQPEL